MLFVRTNPEPSEAASHTPTVDHTESLQTRLLGCWVGRRKVKTPRPQAGLEGKGQALPLLGGTTWQTFQQGHNWAAVLKGQQDVPATRRLLCDVFHAAQNAKSSVHTREARQAPGFPCGSKDAAGAHLWAGLYPAPSLLGCSTWEIATCDHILFPHKGS